MEKSYFVLPKLLYCFEMQKIHLIEKYPNAPSVISSEDILKELVFVRSPKDIYWNSFSWQNYIFKRDCTVHTHAPCRYILLWKISLKELVFVRSPKDIYWNWFTTKLHLFKEIVQYTHMACLLSLGSPCCRTRNPLGIRFSMMIMSSFVLESPVHLNSEWLSLYLRDCE